MFEKILTGIITITVQMYINLQLKKAFKSINKEGKYNMKVTSKLGGFALAISVKESPIIIISSIAAKKEAKTTEA